jgi:hypothetical protein
LLNAEVERLLAETGRAGWHHDRRTRSTACTTSSQAGPTPASELASVVVSPSLYRQLCARVIESSRLRRGSQAADGRAAAGALPAVPSDGDVGHTWESRCRPGDSRPGGGALKTDPSQFAAAAAQLAGPARNLSAGSEVLLSRASDKLAKLQKTRKNEIFSTRWPTAAPRRSCDALRWIETPSLEKVSAVEAQTLQQASAAGKKYLQAWPAISGG